jgi:pimeloyl-ACP methyl ester carboxylesterase
MSFFEHDGIQFRYEISGEGPAIVFTHGLGGDLSLPKDLLGKLAGYRVLLWDVRAHGETHPLGSEEGLVFPTLAQDLRALLDHVGIDRVVVGGISMGAGISAAFSVRWPERVRALVLVRPAWVDQSFPANLAWFPKVAQLLEAAGPGATLETYQSLPEFEPFKDSPLDPNDGFYSQLIKTKAYEYRARLDRIPKSCPISSWKDAAVLTMPTLICENEQDPTHPCAFAQEWARRLPNARLQRLPPKREADAHRAAFQTAFHAFLEEIRNQPAAR